MKNTSHAFIIGNKKSSRSIALILKKEFPEFEIGFCTENVQSAPAYLRKNPAGIPVNYLTVYDILSKLQQKYSSIIFMTESEHPVHPAFKEEADGSIANHNVLSAGNNAVTNFGYGKISSPQSKINLPTLQGFKRVNINEIIRCEADSNYTFIYMLDKTKVMVSKTLHDFEKNLSDYNFFRIHHKHLINLEHLKEYIKGKGGQVVMADNSVLDVSIRRKNEFLHKMI
jgi:two-component system, LytTR family, response regulator